MFLTVLLVASLVVLVAVCAVSTAAYVRSNRPVRRRATAARFAFEPLPWGTR